MNLGIARELTGKRRNRVFGYDRYLKILREGTEPHQLETGDDPFSELFSSSPKIVDIQGARHAGR